MRSVEALVGRLKFPGVQVLGPNDPGVDAVHPKLPSQINRDTMI
jgi:hypothetical protein